MTDIDTSLVLHELQVELPQECDYLAECHESVEWETNCRLCNGYAYCCEHHRHVLAAKQRFEDTRKGMRCPVCKGVAFDLIVFSPIRSRDEKKLW